MQRQLEKRLLILSAFSSKLLIAASTNGVQVGVRIFAQSTLRASKHYSPIDRYSFGETVEKYPST